MVPAFARAQRNFKPGDFRCQSGRLRNGRENHQKRAHRTGPPPDSICFEAKQLLSTSRCHQAICDYPARRRALFFFDGGRSVHTPSKTSAATPVARHGGPRYDLSHRPWLAYVATQGTEAPLSRGDDSSRPALFICSMNLNGGWRVQTEAKRSAERAQLGMRSYHCRHPGRYFFMLIV
jgi:hypothetical protein